MVNMDKSMINMDKYIKKLNKRWMQRFALYKNYTVYNFYTPATLQK